MEPSRLFLYHEVQDERRPKKKKVPKKSESQPNIDELLAEVEASLPGKEPPPKRSKKKRKRAKKKAEKFVSIIFSLL